MNDTAAFTLFHNPACSHSRQVLALIRAHGIEPQIVEYLQTPPDSATLRALVQATGEPVRALLRDKEPLYAALNLDHARWTDEQLIECIRQHPVLLNRPMVWSPSGARLCRPPERVLDLLPPAPTAD